MRLAALRKRTSGERSESIRYSKRPIPRVLGGANFTFEPGARTAWHTHPLGQTLTVTSGVGLVRRWESPIEEVRPGDVVWFEPGESIGTVQARQWR